MCFEALIPPFSILPFLSSYGQKLPAVVPCVFSKPKPRGALRAFEVRERREAVGWEKQVDSKLADWRVIPQAKGKKRALNSGESSCGLFLVAKEDCD